MKSIRDESPKRRKLGRRTFERDEYDSTIRQLDRSGQIDRPLDRSDRANNRYPNYRERGRDNYDNYIRRDDYRDNKYRNMNMEISRRGGDERDNDSGDYQDQRGNHKDSFDEGMSQNYFSEQKVNESERRIPCTSLCMKDPEAFARMLLLPADVIQNVILQLANNNKQALVGRTDLISSQY